MAAFAAILAACLGTLGYLQYNRMKEDARRSAMESMAAIGELQAGEIAYWYRGRIADAEVIQAAPLPGKEFRAFLAQPAGSPLRKHLVAWMDSIQQQFDYDSVALYDSTGKLCLVVPPEEGGSKVEISPAVLEAAGSGLVKTLDLRRDAASGQVFLHILVPVGKDAGAPGLKPGVLVLRIDPSHFLFPKVGKWPTPSPSAETLLVRREGREVVVLSPTRHGAPEPMSLRLPVDQRPSTLVTRAVLAPEGVAEADDYRGVPVLGAFRKISGTPWSLVSMVEQKEIYGPLRRQARDLAVVLGALTLASTAGAGLVWHRRNLALAEHELDQEHRRLEFERKFRAFFEQAAVGVAEVDSHTGRFLRVNQRYCDLLGYQEQEMLSLGFRDITHPEDLQSQLEAMDRLRSGAMGEFTLEKRYQRKDGSTLWGVLTVSPLWKPGDEPGNHMAVVQDITLRKAQEAQLEQLNRLYLSYSQINLAIIRSVGRDSLFSEVCRVLVEFGRFKMAWIGVRDPETEQIQPVAEFGDDCGYLKTIRVFADERTEGRGPTGTAWRERRTCVSNRFFQDPLTLPWRGPARLSGWRSSIAVPVSISDRTEAVLTVYADQEDSFGEKEIALLEEAAMDISFAVVNLETAAQRHKAEESVRRASAYTRSLIEASLDPLVTIGEDGRITDVNSSTEQVTGCSRGELVGSDFADYFTEPEMARTGYQRVFQQGVVLDYPLEIRHRDGHVTPVLYNASVYRDEAGAVAGVFAAARDITKLKEARDQLDQTVQELQRSNMELEQFAYVASHDLQEPLRSIASFTQLLTRRYGDRFDQDGREFAQFIVDGATRMQVMISDLLAFSRVGTRGSPFEAVDVNRVLDDALQNLQAAIQESGARLTRGKLPVVRADRGQLVELFQNLLGNAIKFRSGRPLEIAVMAARTDRAWAFSVKDNGIGMEPQFFERIFIVFQKLHGREDYPGSGIGLAICKKIVERHGGRIWVDSILGKGATFHFTIPDRTVQGGPIQ